MKKCMHLAMWMSFCALLGQAAGCAVETVPLTRSAQIPLARGQVRTRALDDGSTRVMVKIENLVPPQTLREGASTYVVWAQPRLEPGDVGAPSPQALGGLEVDGGMTGRLDTVTRLSAFDVFITPEPSAGVANPGGDHVAWAAVRRAAR